MSRINPSANRTATLAPVGQSSTSSTIPLQQSSQSMTPIGAHPSTTTINHRNMLRNGSSHRVDSSIRVVPTPTPSLSSIPTFSPAPYSSRREMHHHHIENRESLEHHNQGEDEENDAHDLYEEDEDDIEDEENEDNVDEEDPYHCDEYIKEEDVDAAEGDGGGDESNDAELGEWAESSTTPSNPSSEYEQVAISHESEAINEHHHGHSGGGSEDHFDEPHHYAMNRDAQQHFGSDYQAHSSIPSSLSTAAPLARPRMAEIIDTTGEDEKVQPPLRGMNDSDDSPESIPPNTSRSISSNRARVDQSPSMLGPPGWFHSSASSATPRIGQLSNSHYVDSSDSSRRASEQSYQGIGSLMRSTHERPPTDAANDRPRKRIKKEEDTQEGSPTVKSPSDKEDVVSQHDRSHEQDDEYIDMICNICLELPPSQIYRQFDRSKYNECGNGHLLCKDCHFTLLSQAKPLCPTCRQKLLSDHPIRNRIAEDILSKRMVKCSNKECEIVVRFRELASHLSNSCGFRPAYCEYRIAGCKWEGTANRVDGHKKSCIIGSHPSISTIMQHIQLKQEQFESQKKLIKQQTAIQGQLCKMLSKRCRNVSMHDVILKRDDFTGFVCSNPFRACDLRWEVHLEPLNPNQPQVKIFLRVISPIVRKTTIECFTLAPSIVSSTADIEPTLRRVVFRRQTIQSESFPLHFNPDQSRMIHQSESLELRMGFIDISPGPIADTFSSASQPGQVLPDYETPESEGESEEDELRDEEYMRSTPNVINVNHANQSNRFNNDPSYRQPSQPQPQPLQPQVQPHPNLPIDPRYSRSLHPSMVDRMQASPQIEYFGHMPSPWQPYFMPPPPPPPPRDNTAFFR